MNTKSKSSSSSTGTLSSNSSKNYIRSAGKLSPPFASSTPTSAQSTPKKVPQKSFGHFSASDDYDFVISGSPAPRIYDRADSLPSAYSIRPSIVRPGSNETKIKKTEEGNISEEINFREENMSLNLSDVLDLEKLNFHQCDSLIIQKLTLSESRIKKSTDRSKELHPSPSSRNSKSRISGQATKMGNFQSYSDRTQSIEFDNSTNSKSTKSDIFQRNRSSEDLSPRRSTLSQVTSKDTDSISSDYTSGQTSIDGSPKKSLLDYTDPLEDFNSDNSAIQSDVAVRIPFSPGSEYNDVIFPTSISSHMSNIEYNQRFSKNPYEPSTNKEEFNMKYGTHFQDSGEWSHLCAYYNDSSSSDHINKLHNQCTTPFNTRLPKNQARESENIPNSAITKLSETLSEAKLFKRDDLEIAEDLQNAVQKNGISLTAEETNEIMNCAHTLIQVLSSALQRFPKNKKTTKEKEKNADTNHDL